MATHFTKLLVMTPFHMTGAMRPAFDMEFHREVKYFGVIGYEESISSA